MLSAAKLGEVHVVVAAPGQGKSMFMREEIADRIKAGTLSRVLWAVHAIKKADSLGREAEDAFKALGVDCEIIRPHKHFSSNTKAFQRQFDWPRTPAVRIISHARLPMIFGGGGGLSTRLAGADLLVIDEDPSSGVLLASPTDPYAPRAWNEDGQEPADLRLNTLAASGDPVCVALADVADRAAISAISSAASGTVSGAVTTFASPNNYASAHGLTGTLLWPELARLHPVNTSGLEGALVAVHVRPEEAVLIAVALTEDAARAAAGGPERLRFGVLWPGKTDLTGPALLRYNLRRPLNFNLPVVVLDGYADEAYYTTLFAEQSVTFHGYDPGLLLDVECFQGLALDPMHESTIKALENRTQIAEELARQAAPTGRPQLMIASKKFWKARSLLRWCGLVEVAYHRVGKPEPKRMHWHAGRGLNTYAGRDVYALNAGRLSRMHRHHTLSAVFPDQPLERKRLHVHAEGSELLQMLNRGRQPRYAPPLVRPRIVVGQSQEDVRELLGPLISRVALRDYAPSLLFTRRSHNARWRDMTAALAGELLDSGHFPNGLTATLLKGLPKNGSSSAGSLKAWSALLKFTRTCPVGSHLHSAYHDSGSWQYDDVMNGGASSDDGMLDDAMAAVGLTKVAGKPKVYLKPGATKEQVSHDCAEFVKAHQTKGVAGQLP
ncbi:hypothetical protein DEFR109230_09635 [Deinococcus frigens]